MNVRVKILYIGKYFSFKSILKHWKFKYKQNRLSKNKVRVPTLINCNP